MNPINYDELGKVHPKLLRNQVWCKKCGRTETVNSGDCLRFGWPTCCNATMTIDSPEERQSAQPHGGAHNDTICVAERKITKPRDLFSALTDATAGRE